MVVRWIDMLRVIAASRLGDAAAARAGLARLEQGADELPPWITKDLTFARAHVARMEGATDRAVALFVDPWVLNHNGLFDPGRGRAQPGLHHFALVGILLAAETLEDAGRHEEARRLLEQLTTTYHRGIGAVLVHRRASEALRRASGGRGRP